MVTSSSATQSKKIDSNIQPVLESGQYVMGPMLERFERELADFTE